MESPFIGAEAIREGAVRKHELRSRFRAVYPGVYLPRSEEPSFAQRAEAAWLWSQRNGVLAGLTAAKLHGAKWIDDALPIELMWSNGRPPPGLCVFRDQLSADECVLRGGLPLTGVHRTAFDIGRRGRIGDAVARLDALGNAIAVDAADVARLAALHKGARGVVQLRRALKLYDPGAQSPKETWLRLLVIGSGFPRPRTQIPVNVGGRTKYYLDMGWEEHQLALEYDGDHHRSDRLQFARDITRLEELADMGWTVLRVAAGTTSAAVIARLHRAWASKVR